MLAAISNSGASPDRIEEELRSAPVCGHVAVVIDSGPHWAKLEHVSLARHQLHFHGCVTHDEHLRERMRSRGNKIPT